MLDAKAIGEGCVGYICHKWVWTFYKDPYEGDFDTLLIYNTMGKDLLFNYNYFLHILCSIL